jgi:hypothetical protein
MEWFQPAWVPYRRRAVCADGFYSTAGGSRFPVSATTYMSVIAYNKKNGRCRLALLLYGK